MPARKSKAAATPEEKAAAQASLHYMTDMAPGISRIVTKAGFSYKASSGKRITDAATLNRIKALVIPPAWTDVWIAENANAHLQATGRDARGRKQYRYHTQWRNVRDEAKYGRTARFGATLPDIRKRVNADLNRTGLSRDRVLATIVRLLELTFIRVGNTEYAKSNKSFGLTTLQDRHVRIAGARVTFKFRGKSGKAHEIHFTDKRLALLIKRCRAVPGQDLFQYLDDDGDRHVIRSTDVNAYLRGIANRDFTAKDFRTWAGTLLAASALLKARQESEGVTKESAIQTVQAVAEQLGNTPAVCRKCYIHPAVLNAFQDSTLSQRLAREYSRSQRTPGLTAEESALLRFLNSKEAQAAVASTSASNSA